MYEDSIDEQYYLTSIRKEKDAFERLIREKAVRSLYDDYYILDISKFMPLGFVEHGDSHSSNRR
jgi:hypothetical protein